MKRLILLSLVLVGCTPVVEPQPALITILSSTPPATATPSVTPSAEADALAWAQVTMVFAHATDTQVAIAKTEQAVLDTQATQAANTQLAAGMLTAQATQTFAQATARATQTQIAQTQSAWQTSTALAATQQVESHLLMARKTGIWGGVFLFSLLGLLLLAWVAVWVWRSYKSGQANYLQQSRMAHDANGRLDAVPADALPSRSLVVPSLAHRAVVGEQDDLSTEQALANAGGVRQLEAVRAISASPLARRLLATARAGSQPSVAGDVAINEGVAQLPFPDWSLLDSWTGGPKPLGLGANGLITVAAASPHVLAAGTTGAGKTHFLMRPLTAMALAGGEQVFILSLSSNGYGVFDGHPNCYRVQLQDAREIIPVLKAVYRELRERDALIGGRDLVWEQWSDAPRPGMTLVLDELGNMAEQIYVEHKDPKACQEMWGYVRMIAREGRKVGITFVAALQEPTAKSVDLSFRRNCTRVGFLLGDRDSSQALLDVTGAEQLEVGRFIARVSTLVHGAGFAPSDAEIEQFLRKRAVPALERPHWIEGRLSAPSEAEPARVSLAAGDPKQAQAEALIAQGKSDAEIVREVWRVTGGSSFYKKIEQIKAWRTSSTSSNLLGLERAV